MKIFTIKNMIILLSSFIMIGLNGCESKPGTNTSSKINTDLKETGIALNPELSLSETKKMELLRDDVRPVKYNFILNSVALYASTAPGKPCRHPSEPIGICDAVINDPNAVFQPRIPVYSNGLQAAFVEKGGDESLWFAYMPLAGDISKIIWQVSERPFMQDKDNWNSPLGLIASGEVGVENGEFELDFAHLAPLTVSPVPNNPAYTLEMDPRYYPKQKIYYIRAVALDNDDQVIGTPGKGLQIIYGYPYSTEPKVPYTFLFELKSPNHPGVPTTGGEFPNTLENMPEHTYFEQDTSPWYFRPEGFPQTTDTLYLQVSKRPLGTGQNDWRNPAGLLHEIKLTKGMSDFDNLTDPNHAIPIDFKSFAIFPSECYVRAVALSPGEKAGTVLASYSKSVKMLLKEDEDSQIVMVPPPEEIEAPIPTVKLLQYVPIRWEYFEWEYYYKVIRQPTYGDISPVFNSTSMEKELVPELPVGTVIKFEKPKPEHKTWYEEAWDTIKNFFQDMISFLSDIVNWVSKTYNSIKAGIINFVAENLPLVPDSLRDELKQALTAIVDYGLASMGIPPELPNFDELTSMGSEYLAATALDAAGIPTAIVDPHDVLEVTGELAEEVDHQMSSSAQVAGPNPLHWNFVQLNPDTLYRPAFMLLEISNPHSRPTVTGNIEGVISTNLENIHSDPNKEWLNATYCGSTYFELFRPVHMTIPTLQPGQTITVPVVFQEYTGEAYPFCPVPIQQNDFIKLYNLNSFHFDFTMRFDLPPIDQYIQEIGLPVNNTGYQYDKTRRTIEFDTSPSKKLAG